MSKKYNITIEQPMILSFSVSAKDIEEAQERASEKFNSMDSAKMRAAFEFGTDAQVQIESEDGEESTEWTDL